MIEEKVYTCQSKTQLWAPLAMFFFGAFWFVKDIVVWVNTGAYDTINGMWVFKQVFLLYWCFAVLHAIPKKIAFRDDETVCITFLLGNTITIPLEKFKLVRNKKWKPNGKWGANMWIRGRMLFLSSDMYPELEKYLVD